MANKISFIIIMLVFFHVNGLQAQSFSYPNDNPTELGKVHWLRDYSEALAAAKQKNLPVFILFQEVPGCSNCTTFGSQILSQPLIVEAIETCFVPLCIYNNKDGKDKEVLQKYNEPTWNNPVIRIVDQGGKDIVPRQPDFRSTSKTLSTIITAISTSKREVPAYLKLLLQEMEAKEASTVSEAYLSMYCFWSGEKEISTISGVLGTEAGYMHGKEVVKVTFNNEVTKLSTIYNKAQKVGCADNAYADISNANDMPVTPTAIYRKDREDKYYLSKSAYKTVPMTELQKTKVNGAIATGSNPEQYLSPRQISILKNSKWTKNQIGNKIEDVWFTSK
jgi:peptide methionine sulfoxide reductase MsrA